MIELAFIETVAASLASAMSTASNASDSPEWTSFEFAPPEIRKFCRRVAFEMYVTLDSGQLMQLALEKMSLETQIGRVRSRAA